MQQRTRDPQDSTPAAHSLGAQGETLAASYLEAIGYQILVRNWRHGRDGELDLVARDGDCIVAIEVKTRAGLGYGHPFESITARKLSRIRRLLLSWVREQKPTGVGLRIDAVGVTVFPGEEPRIELLRGIG